MSDRRQKKDGFINEIRLQFASERMRAGLSQRAAARKLKINPSILQGFESGERIPRNDTLEAIIGLLRTWQKDSQIRRVAEISPVYGADPDIDWITKGLSGLLDCLLADDVPRHAKLAVTRNNLKYILDQAMKMKD